VYNVKTDTICKVMQFLIFVLKDSFKIVNSMKIKSFAKNVKILFV